MKPNRILGPLFGMLLSAAVVVAGAYFLPARVTTATVGSETAINFFTGNGSQTSFAYTFKIYAAADIRVITRNPATGAETVLASNQYSVGGVGIATGGVVTFTTAPTSGHIVMIRRATPLLQNTNLRNQDRYNPAAVESAIDTICFEVQRNRTDISRTLRTPESENNSASDLQIPQASLRASKLLGFDSAGRVEMMTPGSGGGGGGATSLTELTDVTITSAVVGDLLRNDGTEWVDAVLVAGDIPALDASKITTGTFGTARLATGSVDNTILADMAAGTFKGRIGSTGDPQDLNSSQATSLINVFTSVLSGAVPASGGDAANFLCANGTWTLPPGGTTFTTEMSQDAVGTILQDSSTIDFTYDDNTPLINGIVIDDSITYAKLQNVSATDRLLGRVTASAGNAEEIAVASPITLASDSLDFDETVTLGNNARVAVWKTITGTPTLIGTRRKIHFIEGANITLTVTDDNTNERVDVTIAASGGGGGGTVAVHEATVEKLAAATILDFTTGMDAVDSTGGRATISVDPGEVNHDGLLNYSANKHPDITADVTITGLWAAARNNSQTDYVILTNSGAGTLGLSVDGLVRFDGASFDGTLGIDTDVALTANRTWTMPNLSGTVTVLGNATTGAGAIVRDESPTIVTPTIASLTNAQHTHLNAAGGGNLSASAITSGTFGSAFITDGSVTLADMADTTGPTLFGRASGTGVPQALSRADATTVLNNFTSGLAGLTPASGGGTANFLRADGSWAAPSGGGGGGSVAVEEGESQIIATVASLDFGNGIIATDQGSGSNEANIAIVPGEINHDLLLNYSANKHPDITATTVISGTWSHTNTLGMGNQKAIRFDELTTSTGDDNTSLRAAVDVGTSFTVELPSGVGATSDVLLNSVSGTVATLSFGRVALANMANLTGPTILGRISGTDIPQAMTAAQTTALLDVFTGSAKGLVPSPAGATTTFLKADGTWATPAGGGSSLSVKEDSGTAFTATTLQFTTGVDVSESPSGTAVVAIDSSELNHNGLQNYSTNQHPDITQAVTISGIWTHSTNLVMDNRQPIRFNETTGGGGDFVQIRALASVTAADGYTINLPPDVGATSDVALFTTNSATEVSMTFGKIGGANITDGSVVLADLENRAEATIIGRAAAAGTGVPTALSAAQVTAVIATGSGGGTTNFFRADGTWAAPAGGSVDVNEDGGNIPALAATTAFNFTTGIDVSDGGSNQAVVAVDPGEVDHNLLLNYSANKHADITSTATISGVWTHTDNLLVGAGKEIRLVNSADADYVGIKAPAGGIGTSYTLSMPANAPNSLEVFASGSGTSMTWVATTGSDNIVRATAPTLAGMTSSDDVLIDAEQELRLGDAADSGYVAQRAPTTLSTDTSYAVVWPTAVAASDDIPKFTTSSQVTTMSFGKLVTANVTDDNITYAKIQNAGANVLLGNSGSSGDVEELTAAAGVSITGTTLILDIAELTTDALSSPYDDFVPYYDAGEPAANKILLKDAHPWSNPRRYIAWGDDFLYSAYTTSTFANAYLNFNFNGTGASMQIGAPVAGTVGILQGDTGSATNGRATIQSGLDGIIGGLGRLSLTTRVMVEDLSDANDIFQFRSGLLDVLTTTSVDEINFLYDHTLGTDWRCVTNQAGGGAAVVNASGITVNADEWYLLNIEINADWTQVIFSINGTPVATHVSEIPTSVSNPTGLVPFHLLKAGGAVGTTVRAADIDFYTFSYEFTAQR